jgi:hypothetical protein
MLGELRDDAVWTPSTLDPAASYAHKPDCGQPCSAEMTRRWCVESHRVSTRAGDSERIQSWMEIVSVPTNGFNLVWMAVDGCRAEAWYPFRICRHKARSKSDRGFLSHPHAAKSHEGRDPR